MFSALAICVVLVIVMAFGAIKEIKAFSTLRKLLKEASRSYGDNGDFLTFCLEYNGWQRFSRSRNYKPEKSKIHVDINRGGGNDDTWSERIQIPQGEPESIGYAKCYIDQEQPDALKPYTYMEETQGDIEAGTDPDEKE